MRERREPPIAREAIGHMVELGASSACLVANSSQTNGFGAQLSPTAPVGSPLLRAGCLVGSVFFNRAVNC